MDTFSSGDLTIEVRESVDPAALVLEWTGKSNHRQPAAALTPFWQDVLSHASSGKLPVEMHFEHLEHFNSSTVTAIIHMLQEARTHGVRLVLAFDPSLKWQRLSFDALRIFVKSDGLLELAPALARPSSMAQKAAESAGS